MSCSLSVAVEPYQGAANHSKSLFVSVRLSALRRREPWFPVF